MRPGTPGNAPKPEALPRPGERVYRKASKSAFIGTRLESDLRKARIRTLAIVGLTTNHCISTTARMAGNLGFENPTSGQCEPVVAAAGVFVISTPAKCGTIAVPPCRSPPEPGYLRAS